MKALVYARYFLQENYRLFNYSGFSETVFYSDSSIFLKKDFRYVRKQFERVVFTANQGIYKKLPIEEIILKDRLLRNINAKEAQLLIKTSFCYWCKVLEEESPDYIITQAVDNYILHVAELVSLHKGVNFIGLVPAPFGLGTMLTSQTSTRGYSDFIDRSFDEIELKILSQNAIIDYRKRSAEHKKLGERLMDLFRYNIKLVFFPLLAFFDKEKRSAYHWRVMRYSFRYYFKNASDFVNSKNVEFSSEKKTVLIPLNCAPEMSFDYWVNHRMVGDYERFLIEMVKVVSEDFNVVIKEHPHGHYTRPKGFFASLSQFAKIDVSMASVADIIEKHKPDVIYSGNSSFSIESLLKGIPVIWYSKAVYCRDLKLFSSARDLNSTFKAMSKNDCEEDGKKILEWLSKNTMKGDFWDGTLEFSLEKNI